MSLMYFLLKYFDRGYDMVRIIRIYDYLMNNNQLNISGYSAKPNYGIEKKNISQNFYLNKNYLLMKNQERKCHSRFTEISRKGLEKRIMHKAMKEVHAERENKMKKSLSRKGKRSRRWEKRHHQNV
ncbi:MAG: hypothetical protein M1416_03615 [Candidatus Pacearchaeota archaeon]|nr:hypothetical protein [Candidatus Pacearchaeota archaeon]